ncbi:hypothetical protein Tco_0261624 [Tanacetum coccineum]
MRFIALGWHLEDLHVTWAHLEKKQTRLRTYTKSLGALFIQSVETASHTTRDDVLTIRRRRQRNQDGVRTSTTEETLEIDNIPSWGNSRRKEVGENGPDWVVRSKFEDELAGIHEQLSQILSQIRSNETPEPDAPTFAITTRSGTITHDLPYPTLLESITINHAEEMDEKEGPEGEEPGIVQDEESPQQITLYSPSKLSSVPFPSRLKKKKKDEDEERLLSVFKQIHVNLPFLEAMIHMPKGAKVLKDLLSHKEKLEMAASSVKLSKECSGVI